MTALARRGGAHVGRPSELAVLNAAKAVSNTALRWVGPFLPTLERAFGASTGTLTGIIGATELGGLSTMATGGLLDRGHERRIFLIGTAAVGVSSLIALAGSVTAFAVSFAVMLVGHANLVVAGHAWIGHRVPFAARSRAIGIFETSWAVSLLVGAPIIALSIRWFGWRGAYGALAIGSVIGFVAVSRLVSGAPPHEPDTPSGSTRRAPPLPASAWPPIVAAAATAAAGLSIVVVSGAWLDDDHGFSTGGLGVVAAAFGAVELVSSSSVALVGDRVGTRRSVIAGLVVLAAGLAVMGWLGGGRGPAIVGLLVFLAGFEYGFVSSLALVTEAAPRSRGRAIGIGNAVGTVARAGAVIASGQLYEAFGIGGPVALAGGAAALAMIAVVVPRPADLRTSDAAVR